MAIRSHEPCGLEGAFNFRDLGDLRTNDGRLTRRGRLYRSDTLQVLTTADVERVSDEIELELIVDLRFGPEAEEEGRGPLVERSISYLNAPLRNLPISDLDPDQQNLHFYLEHLRSPTPPLATVIRVLSGMAGRPTLLHCAAGKDRTGLVSALVLRMLDVSDDEIVADYLRSAANMDRIVERLLSWPRYREHIESVPPEVYHASEHTMRGFLDALDCEFGGAVGWAKDQGIGASEVERLRDGLLVDA